jgi:hypothetical protein
VELVNERRACHGNKVFVRDVFIDTRGETQNLLKLSKVIPITHFELIKSHVTQDAGIDEFVVCKSGKGRRGIGTFITKEAGMLYHAANFRSYQVSH